MAMSREWPGIRGVAGCRCSSPSGLGLKNFWASEVQVRRSQGLTLSRPSCLQELEKENEELDTRHSVFLRFMVGCREG